MTITAHPEGTLLLPLFTAYIFVVFQVVADGDGGDFELTVAVRTPQGDYPARSAAHRGTLHHAGDGFVAAIPLHIAIEEPGVYWFTGLLNGVPQTRLPLFVRFQRSSAA